MAQRKVYYIPDNFVDDEKIFGGKFRKRNFIEAVILGTDRPDAVSSQTVRTEDGYSIQHDTGQQDFR